MKETHLNPFAQKTPDQVYELLTQPALSGGELPQWPVPEVQTGYVGIWGPAMVRFGLKFIDVLDKDGAYIPGWRGLDYGCGFGRFAALHLSKGTPQQLDLVDAWTRAIDLIKQGNFKNRCWCVSEMLKDLDIPANSYDLIISFSVFTHFSQDAFLHNLERLCRALKPNGRTYLTVRHEDFVPVKFRDTADAVMKALDQRGIYWQPTQNKFETEPVFGTTIVTPAFMEEMGKRFGLSRRLQSQVNYQHIWVITNPENTR